MNITTKNNKKIILSLSSLLLIATMSSCDIPIKGQQDKKQRLIERFDEDGDGMLNEQERAAARQAMGTRGQKGPRGQRGARPMRGETSEDSTSTGPAGKPKLTTEQKQRVLQRFDANGDGVLDEEERAHVKRALQQRRARREGREQ